jgi:hypothetical protein
MGKSKFQHVIFNLKWKFHSSAIARAHNHVQLQTEWVTPIPASRLWWWWWITIHDNCCLPQCPFGTETNQPSANYFHQEPEHSSTLTLVHIDIVQECQGRKISCKVNWTDLLHNGHEITKQCHFKLEACKYQHFSWQLWFCYIQAESITLMDAADALSMILLYRQWVLLMRKPEMWKSLHA